MPKGEKQMINNQQEDWKFSFNKVLHNAPQETVFEQCAMDIIQNVLEGYNGERKYTSGPRAQHVQAGCLVCASLKRS